MSLGQGQGDGELFLFAFPCSGLSGCGIICNDSDDEAAQKGRQADDHPGHHPRRLRTDTAPYGTIHRIAAGGAGKGIFRECLAYCLARIPNIRIDTHRDNAAMRHLLERHGFRECGIIYVEDGSPRIAYQKCL